MSYDLRIGVKVDGTDIIAVIDQPEYRSPTYNLREMFVACMNWDYHQSEWYRVSDVLPNIERGVKELTVNEREYEKYNSPNGWGTTESALRALKSLQECIYGIIAGDRGWQEIPVEHLYMRW